MTLRKQLARSRFTRSRFTHLIASYGLAQLSIALGAILRIPLTVGAIGVGGLGTVLVVGAVVPLLLIPGVGLRSAARTLFAEDFARGGQRLRRTNRQGVVLTRRVATPLAAFTLCLVPLDLLHLGSDRGLTAVQVITVLLGVASLDGLWFWGALEALDKAHVPNLGTLCVTIGGLVAVACLAAWGAPLELFVLANVATSTLPFLVASIVGRRCVAKALIDVVEHDEQPVDGLLAATMNYSVRGLANAITRGSEPLVVNGFLAASAVGVFTLAQRFGIGIALVSVAILPRLAAQSAQRRSQGSGRTYAEVTRLMRRTMIFSLVPTACYLGLVTPVVRMMAGPEAVGPPALYLTIALASLLLAVESPLEASLSGGVSLRSTRWALLSSATVTLAISLCATYLFGVAGPAIGAIAGLLLLMAQELRILRKLEVTGDRTLMSGPARPPAPRLAGARHRPSDSVSQVWPQSADPSPG